jgi:O-acetylserine/cysteine efflux transporter
VKPRHIALAILLTVLWGLNFIAMHYGLLELPPLFFAAARFVIAGLPVLFVPMPKVPFRTLLWLAMTLFVGQFALLFPGMQIGYPPGLASLTLQVQVFFTVIMAALTIGERPRPHHWLAMVVAFAGLALIAGTVGVDGVTVLGLIFLLASAFSWAVGNLIMRRLPPVDSFALISWLSVLAILPLMAISVALEGLQGDYAALLHLSGRGLLSLLYVAVISTIVGYRIWGELLKRYPAADVAPFTLLVPVTGMAASYLILGETLSPLRLVGGVLIMAGLVVNVFGGRILNRLTARA